MIKKTKKQAVSYIRMSSAQQDMSPDRQRDENKRLAEKHGFEIIREYCDLAISGTETTKRKDFVRMIDDAKNKTDFKAILCWDQDRFGRFDSLEAGEWISPLRRAGIDLITSAQGIIDWNDFAGRLVYSITQEGKNQYVRDLSRNVLSGVMKSHRDGKMNFGATPYGFDKLVYDENGEFQRRIKKGKTPEGWTTTLSPSEQEGEVETVKLMYDLYASGQCGMRAIADELNSQGIVPVRSSSWNSQSVRNILKNPVYCGDYVYGRRRNGKFFRHTPDGVTKSDAKGKMTENPKEDWFIIKDAFEPIVSRDIWQQVQDRRSSNRQWTCTSKGEYVFTKLLYCGNCGKPMHGTKMHGKLGYICSSYNHKGSAVCNHNTIKQDDLLPFMVETIRKYAFAGNNLDKLKKSIRKKLDDRSSGGRQIKRLENKLQSFKKEIKGAVKKLARCPDEIAELLTTEIATMQSNQSQIESQLASMRKTSPTNINAAVEKIASRVWTLNEDIQSADPRKIRDVMHSFVSRVDLQYKVEIPEGKKRAFNKFDRGSIHLRPSESLQSCEILRANWLE